MSSKSTPKVSRGLRVLPKSATSKGVNVKAERDALMGEIAQIEQWWRGGRWNGTTRTYTGECRSPVIARTSLLCNYLIFLLLHLFCVINVCSR